MNQNNRSIYQIDLALTVSCFNVLNCFLCTLIEKIKVLIQKSHLFNDFLGQNNKYGYLISKCLCSSSMCWWITKEIASSSDRRAGVGLLSGFFFFFLLQLSLHYQRKLKSLLFPQTYLCLWGSLGFWASSRLHCLYPFPLPKETPWGTQGTPSDPLHTRKDMLPQWQAGGEEEKKQPAAAENKAPLFVFCLVRQN